MPDQRHAERLSLSMTVQLIARGLNRRSCRMKDISPGGALLELPEGVTETGYSLKRGDVVILRMFLGQGESSREHELRARIAHIDPSFLGLCFFNPDDATLRLLLSSASRPAGMGRDALGSVARQLLGQLGQQVLAFCRYRLPDFFKSAEEAMFHAADNARSNTDQRMYFDAVTLLRQQKDAVKSRFLQALEDTFSNSGEAYSHARSRPDISGLALVDRHQFEEWLIVKVLSGRVEVGCRRQLFALQVRLDALAEVGEGHHQPNRFAPRHICEAFQEAIAMLHPSTALERLLYHSFEATILSGFCSLYEALNDTLIRNGVLPELDLSRYVVKHPDGSQELVTDASLEAVRQADLVVDVASRQASVSRMANAEGLPAVAVPPAGTVEQRPLRGAAEYMARTGGRQRFETSPRDGRGAVAALKRLFEVQGVPGDRGAVTASAEGAGAGGKPAMVSWFDVKDVQLGFDRLKSAGENWRPVLEIMVADSGQALSGALLSLLQMSDGLLKSLTQNPRIGEPARVWFRRLELPLLHALMVDDDFLRCEDHPARRVLDALARLGLRDHPPAPEQVQEIDRLVEEIARGFDQQPDVFVMAMAVLEPLVRAQEITCQRNLDHVRQLAEGEYRLECARRSVQQVLDERLAGKRVPQPVVKLVESGWRDVLVKTHMRLGEESREWRDCIGVLDELLAIGADMHRTFDLRSILRQIKFGLQELGEAGGRQQQQAVSELKLLLSGSLRAQRDVAWVQLPVYQVGGSGDPVEERWLAKWMDRACRLQPGDWLELRHRGEDADRMRLAWRAADDSRFVFVNHQGIKVSDFLLRELAALMHTGNALIFEGDDIPVVDDALERLVHQRYDQLAWHATHDELTGLVNRTEFTRQLQRVVDDAKRKRSRHVVGYINLDQFKLVNSTSGRAAGDQLLKDVAHLLNKALKAKTLVSRLNADEFGILLEDCDLGRAQQLVSLRLGELTAMKFTWSSQTYHLTASAGLVDITYASDNDASTLRAAEEACVQAKKDGGNRIRIYQPDAAELNRRDNVMVWVAKLNQALEQERLTLRCQKICPVDPGRRGKELPHFEILLGLQDDGGDDLPPSEFVQAAERYNRMLAVDRWVVDSALHWMKDNPSRMEDVGMLSINLSGHSLSDAQMMGYVFDRLLEYGIPPEKICFEIAETTAIGNLPDAVDLMRELKKAGCRFALDDFGAGHATYNCLKHLPLDFVKIDGGFVRNIATDENDFAMVRSINDLAHYMGIKTIAEFVESEAILARLQEIGVDYAQGYCIERPRWLDSL